MTLGHLIDALRNKYPLNVLADASLLPNYAFPETGVKLHSRIGSDTEEKRDDGKKKRVYEKREYVRPAARALRELAPFNTFYAEGHKVRIRELDLGPKASRVQHWRFCPSCHHRSPAIDPTAPPTEPVCPRCQDPNWADKGQVRTMLPMNTVRSVADRVRSTTVDDVEERAQESFHIHQLFDVRPENLEGEAVLLPDVGFGFEYLREVTLTEVNTGLTVTLEGAPKVKVGGEWASVDGFPTCRDCGTVSDPRFEGRRDAPPGHSPFCPQKGGDTKPREPLYLYREVQSEAVRFLLPFSEMHVEPKLRSFQAAVAFGLRRKFGGRPMHLQVDTMSEPAGDNREARRHFLVLFDSVPGGTGYLRDYRKRREIFGMLQDALEGLRSCSCRTRGRDGCYLCLFARQSQRYLPILSSQLAEDLLDRIVRERHKAEAVDGGLSATTVAAVLESELEEKFIASMQLRFGEAFRTVDSGEVWQLDLGAHVWRVEPQQWVSDVAGEAMRCDFLFTSIQGPALGEQVLVECDGHGAHVQPDKPEGRVTSDLRKRGAVSAHPGWRVFQLTWHDLDPSKATSLVPDVLCGVPDPIWAKILDKLRKRFPSAAVDTIVQLPKLGPMQLLCSYLEHPGEHWTLAITALICGRLAAAGSTKALVDQHGLFRLEDHLRQQATLSPLPPTGLEQSGRPPRWGLAELSGDLAVLSRAKARAVGSFDPDGIEVLVRLDDRELRRADPAFIHSWRSALQALNLLWFLPNVEVLTDEAMADQIDPETGLDVLAELGIAADGHAPYAVPEELDRALRNCFDDRARSLLRGVVETGLPLADIDRSELAEAVIPDLSWSDLRVAVVDPDHAEPEDLDLARAAGWQLVLLPVDLDALLATIRHAMRTP